MRPGTLYFSPLLSEDIYLFIWINQLSVHNLSLLFRPVFLLPGNFNTKILYACSHVDICALHRKRVIRLFLPPCGYYYRLTPLETHHQWGE